MKINRTTERSVQILKLVSGANDGLDMDEICERLNIPRTSCYDILVTLVHMGMLEVNTLAKKSYKIGLNAYRIGMSYTNNRNISEIISPALKELAKELAPSNILVNAISPGFIDTDMNKVFEKDELDTIFEEIPLGRAGQPSEVANLVYKIATSNYITGQIITVDGGWT